MLRADAYVLCRLRIGGSYLFWKQTIRTICKQSSSLATLVFAWTERLRMKPVMHLRGSIHAKMYRRPVVNCSMIFFRNCWLQGSSDRIIKITTTISLSIYW